MTKQNPFLERGMIKRQERFFGRQAELDFCLQRLREMQNVSVIGERRIGKSSFLYRLTQIIPEQADFKEPVLVRYVDMQAIPDDASFWPAVLKALGKEGETPLDFVQALRDQRVILCLDEFDRAADPRRFDDDFFNTLRSIANQGYLAMVAATQKPLNELIQPGLTSSFFNLFVRLDLDSFSQDDRAAVQERILTLARESDQPLSRDEVTRAWEKTGGHPWKLMVYLSHLWEAKQADPWDEAEVERLYEAEIKQGRPARQFEQRESWRRLESWITGLAAAAGGIFLFAITTRNPPALWVAVLLAVIVATLTLYALLQMPRSV
jgi:hypothetical protein